MLVNGRIVLLLGTVFFVGSEAFSWFVSRNSGLDGPDCGTETNPCKSIAMATYKSQPGDSVYLNGTNSEPDPYPCNKSRLVSVGLSFFSYGDSQAFIRCDGFEVQCPDSSTQNTSLNGLVFVNTEVVIGGCSLTLHSCIFRAFVKEGAKALNFTFGETNIGNIVVDKCFFENNSAGCLSISGNKIDLTVKSTAFQNNNATSFQLTSDAKDDNQRVYNVQFIDVTVANNKCLERSCINIDAGKSGRSTLKFHNTTFTENLLRGQSVVNVVGTSDTTLHVSRFENNTAQAIRFRSGNVLHLSISDGTFRNNSPLENSSSGGVVMATGFNDINVGVFDSRFVNNRSPRWGGAICLLSFSQLLLHINNTKFNRNQAGFKGGALAIGCDEENTAELNISVLINNTYFTANSVSNGNKKGFLNGGAAISVSSSSMRQFHVERTVFVENKCAQCSAGAFFVNGSLFLGNLTMIKSLFRDNYGGVIRISPALLVNQSSPRGSSALMLIDIIFEGNGRGYGQYDVYIQSNLSIVIELWTFKNNHGGGIFLGLMSDLHQSLSIRDSEFANNSEFTFNLRGYSQSSNYTLKNVTFTNNECRVIPKSPPVIQLLIPRQDSVLNIEECKFDNNTCDLSVLRVGLLSSKERGNTSAMSRFHSNSDSFSALTSGFADNYREACHLTETSLDQSKVNIVDSEFRNNCGMSESTVTLQNGKIELINNTFINNFGFVWGSHIYVADGAVAVDIINATFLQKRSTKQIWNKEVPFRGFLRLTSSGPLNIFGSSFTFSRFESVDQLISIRGLGSVIMDNSSHIDCSHGSRLNFVNLTHCVQLADSPYSSRIVTLLFACRTCPVGTYSTRKGFSIGFQIHSNFTCQPCPFGGNCTNNLAAQPNFWGYPAPGDKVEFVHCPPGYCCPNEKYSCHYRNDTYDKSGCQGNRTGILCGKCRENFTETLFSSRCKLKSKCNDWWWSSILALFVILMFASYLIHKPPILQLAVKNLFWFSRTRQEMGLEGTHPRKQQLGFMKILFYFYQIAGLLTVPSNGTSHVLMDYFVLPFVGLFSFTFQDSTTFDVCPYHGLTQTLKTAVPLLGVLTLHLSVLCIYILHIVLNKLSKRPTVFPPIDPYLAASMECLLLSYSALTYTSLKLLCVVQINGQLRWYYSAAIPMDLSQWWQGVSLFVVLTCVVPFIIVLYAGSRRLYRGVITPRSFILACYVPLPFLIHWLVGHCRAKGRERPEREMAVTFTTGSEEKFEDNLSEVTNMSSTSLVLEVISGPFRKPKDQKSLGRIHWESVLIGRRFILIVVALFVPHEFLTSVCLTVLCLLALLHHVLRKPFHNYYANATETLSLAILVIIATLNIAVGAFYSSGIQVPASYSWLVTAFLIVEAVLLGAVPAFFVLIVAFCGISQVLRLLLFLIKLMRVFSYLHRDIQSVPDRTTEPLLSVPTVDRHSELHL